MKHEDIARVAREVNRACRTTHKRIIHIPDWVLFAVVAAWMAVLLIICSAAFSTLEADEAPPYNGCIALADLDKKLDEFRANGNEITVEDLSTEESTRYVDMFVRLNHSIEGVTRVRIIHHGQKATDIMTIVADKWACRYIRLPAFRTKKPEQDT